MKHPKINRPSIPFYVLISIGIWGIYNYLYRDCFNRAIVDIAFIVSITSFSGFTFSLIADSYDRYVCGKPEARGRFLHVCFSSLLNNISLMFFLITIMTGILIAFEFLILSIIGCYDLNDIIHRIFS